MCVCVTVLFDSFSLKKPSIGPVPFSRWFPWLGGFLLSLKSRLSSDWKCPGERFSLFPHLTYLDRRSVSVQVSFRLGWLLAANQRRFSPVFGDRFPEHAFDEGSEESTVQSRKGQVRAFVEPPLRPPLSPGPRPSSGFTVLTGPTNTALRWGDMVVQRHADRHLCNFFLCRKFSFSKSFKKECHALVRLFLANGLLTLKNVNSTVYCTHLAYNVMHLGHFSSKQREQYYTRLASIPPCFATPIPDAWRSFSWAKVWGLCRCGSALHIALEFHRPSFRSSFLISHIHWSTSVSVRVRFRLGWVVSQIGAVFWPVFEDCLPEHAFDEGNEESTFSVQTIRLEPSSSRHYPVLSRPGLGQAAGSPYEPGLHRATSGRPRLTNTTLQVTCTTFCLVSFFQKSHELGPLFLEQTWSAALAWLTMACAWATISWNAVSV